MTAKLYSKLSGLKWIRMMQAEVYCTLLLKEELYNQSLDFDETSLYDFANLMFKIESCLLVA